MTAFTMVLSVALSLVWPGVTAAATTIASDDFSRTIATGWGSAPIGGAYAVSGGSFSVDGSAGLMTLGQPNANLLASLSAGARDLSIGLRISTDKSPAGDKQYVYAEARRVDGSSGYRLGVRFAPGQGVFLQAGRVINNGETALGSEIQVAGLSQVPGTFVRVRAEVVGTNPTTIRMRAWPDTAPEPSSWPYQVSDSTAALQATGGTALRAYLGAGASNAPILVRFDDVVVTDLGSGTPPPDAVMVGAGDIASCGWSDDTRTAAVVSAIAGMVFTIGDNVYPNGTAAEFSSCYGPTWGQFKARTRPAPGNHEYNTSGASGYFGYFGALAGNPGQGWYAYNLGTWRIYVLNSNCSGVGGCAAGSAQERWLRADLAANPRQCVGAMWHHARFSSGSTGSNSLTAALWQALADARAEFVLGAHDHHYERFSPLSPSGTVDAANGMRQFVVGTGGASLAPFGPTQPGSEVRNAGTYGVIKFTLASASYTWQFVPVAGQTFTDSGQTACH